MFSLIHSAWIKEPGERPDSTWSASEHSEGLCSGTMNPFADMPGVDASYRRIIKAVSALPDVERVVMLLVEVEGLSIDEVAGILEISRADVASRLIQARLTIGRQFTEGRSSTLIAGSTGEQAMARLASRDTQREDASGNRWKVFRRERLRKSQAGALRPARRPG
jgi:RNA polymerase sigma-70 factor (ECF subfamily)